MINLRLLVEITADDDGTNLWAHVPGLPNVFGTGQTPTELGTALGGAIEALLNEAREAAGLPPFPAPVPPTAIQPPTTEEQP